MACGEKAFEVNVCRKLAAGMFFEEVKRSVASHDEKKHRRSKHVPAGHS
jgi:hypothetical protein